MKRNLTLALMMSACMGTFSYGQIIVLPPYMQNIVKNPSFEDGLPLCTPTPNQGPYGPGPFYLAQGYVDSWTGINPSKPGTYPMNTGDVMQNGPTCTFAQFSPGITANDGNRAIGLYLESSATSNYDSRAIGEFKTGTIQNGTYKISLASLGYMYLNRINRPEPNGRNTLQVYLVKQGATNEKLISEFNIPQNTSGTLPWVAYNSTFSVSFLESGVYDRVLLRLKPAANFTNYSEGVFIDNLNIQRMVVTSPVTTVFKGEIKLSPNPASDFASLGFELIKDDKITVQLIDVYGKTIRTPADNQPFKTGVNNIKFLTSDLPDGMYFVTVNTTSETKSLQLMIKH